MSSNAQAKYSAFFRATCRQKWQFSFDKHRKDTLEACVLQCSITVESGTFRAPKQLREMPKAADGAQEVQEWRLKLLARA
jgi:hypothetical protein